MISDKDQERQRYDLRASALLESDAKEFVTKSIVLPLNAPYVCYEKIIKEHLKENDKVLEIGAGTGKFTGILISTGAHVCATDISPASLEVIKKEYRNLTVKIADMESLPFEAESFDAVVSAGSLSYGDNQIVMDEIYRVLKHGGILVAVDSLNNNPIYRLNRWMHYLRGNRTMSTLKRMPNLSLIKKYKQKFGYLDDRYFGSISWAFPLLKITLRQNDVLKFSNWIDRCLSIKASAFKFVMIAKKTK